VLGEFGILSVNRKNKYPITQENKKKKQTIIKTILNKKITHRILCNKSRKRTIEKRNGPAFTFFRPETRTITKLLKNTEIGISCRTRNNIKHLLIIKENKENITNIPITMHRLSKEIYRTNRAKV
jgi:hypothetical protein